MTPPLLVLGSGSPRRLDLLVRHGYQPRVRVPEVDEAPQPGEPARNYALRMARTKLAAVSADDGDVVLTADTVVHLDGELRGKPQDPADARRMLAELSGRWHLVTTAFAVQRRREEHLEAVTTRVRFRDLTPGLIAGYVSTGESLDKAGAYGIQGQGAALVVEIAGSYTNVVGLPVAEVVQALASLGMPDPLIAAP